MPERMRHSPWRRELHFAVHSFAGAFLFGAPFLYTMEVWWRGDVATPGRMLSGLALTFAAVLLLEKAAGTRAGRPVAWGPAAVEATRALAVGLVAAAICLAAIGILRSDLGFESAVGRVAFEGMPFGLGVGLADFIFGRADGGERAEAGDGDGGEPKARGGGWQKLLARAGATALGALIVSATLAPTEEIPLIHSGLPNPWLFVVMAASLGASYLIVFASHFVTGEARKAHGGLESPVGETVFAYVVSLAVATVLLWVFHQIDLHDPVDVWAGRVVVLGFPASVGGAAGRLAA